MTDGPEKWQAKTRLRISKDLREIERMYVGLRAEAVNRAGDPDIPGGAATVLLGPGVDLEAWNYVQLSAAVGRLTLGYRDATGHALRIELEAFDQTEIEPPLSFLASWVDRIRDARGQIPTERRATLPGELEYLRNALDWITSVDEYGVPWWLPVEEFVEGLRTVRRTLEYALRDGIRFDRINAECYLCDERPRLIVHAGEGTGGRDFWSCPNRECRAVYDSDGVAQCFRQMLVRRGAAPEWISVADAATALGRSPSTIRRWIREVNDLGDPIEPRVTTKRDDDGRILVSWTEARAADLGLPRRALWRLRSAPT